MEKQYAILMNRNIIMPGIYSFTPLYIIEGFCEYDEDDKIDCFIDSIMNFEYLLTSNPVSTTTDEVQVVGYVITEKQLKKLYPGDDLETSKTSYFQSLEQKIHIGLFDPELDEISMILLDHNELMNMITGMPSGRKQVNTVLNETKFENLVDGQSSVIIPKDKLEQIISLKDLNKMKEELENIYELVKQLEHGEIIDSNIKEKIDNNIIDDEYILTLFNDAYECLLNIDDLDEMKEVLSKLEEVYIQLLLDLEQLDKVKIKKVDDFLCEFIDKYRELQKYNDICKIKIELAKIMEKEQIRIDKIAKMYSLEEKIEELETEKEETKVDYDKIRNMKKFFDEKIIGQEEAKKDVISAIIMNEFSDSPSDKNNVLLVGPTGSGKTLLAEATSEYLNIPMEIIDTTQLTVPGYVGANIEDFLARLISKSKNLEEAQNGIVVFDEIDKKGTENNGDVNGKGVLNTLLPFIQGTTYDVKHNNKIVHFDTSKLTIFATGAFTDVANKSKTNDYKSSGIGYSTTISKKEDIEYRKLQTDDFVKYGNIPVELIGRFSVITQLNGHTKDSLRTILTESNMSALLKEKEKLSKMNIELKWTDGYLDKVAQKAIELKTGARSLKSTVEKTIKEVRWEVLTNLDIYKAIILTEKTVDNNLDCEIIDLNGNVHNLRDIIDAKNKTNIVLVKK